MNISQWKNGDRTYFSLEVDDWLLLSWTQFHQEKALVGAFSVITNLRMDLFEAQSQVWRRTVSTGLPILCIIYSEQYVECGGGGGVLIERGGALLH